MKICQSAHKYHPLRHTPRATTRATLSSQPNALEGILLRHRHCSITTGRCDRQGGLYSRRKFLNKLTIAEVLLLCLAMTTRAGRRQGQNGAPDRVTRRPPTAGVGGVPGGCMAGWRTTRIQWMTSSSRTKGPGTKSTLPRGGALRRWRGAARGGAARPRRPACRLEPSRQLNVVLPGGRRAPRKQ